MKRFLTLFIVAAGLLALSASCDRSANAKTSNPEIKGLIRAYKSENGFDAVNLGSFAMSLIKSGSDMFDDGDGDETKLIRESIDKLRGVTVADFSDCKASVKEEFKQKLSKLLKKKELLLETKDDGESVLIYSDPSKGDSWVKNLIIYMPDDCDLVCLWGSVNIENVMEYAGAEN